MQNAKINTLAENLEECNRPYVDCNLNIWGRMSLACHE